uniref:Mitochondrial import inner membrane translocase subunit n=1 Tax=Gallus gallus TaxID=9031 RepID=A0A8V1ADI7_CHICK
MEGGFGSDFGSDFGSGAGGGGKLDPGLIMEQVKVQIAVANAQELLQRMTDKCFRKCIGKPGGALDNSEQVSGSGGRCGAVLRLPGLPPLTAPRAAEVHRHVHGPLHGRLERGFSRLQLPAAAGESQHVTRGRSAAAAAINRR